MALRRHGRVAFLMVLLASWAIGGTARAQDLSPGWSGTVSGTLHDHAFNAETDDVTDAATTATVDGSSPDGDGTTTFRSHHRIETHVTCAEGSGIAFDDWTASGTAASPKSVKVTFGSSDDYTVTGGGEGMFTYTFSGGGACTFPSSSSFSGGPVVVGVPCDGSPLPLPADPYTLVGSESCPQESEGHSQLVTVAWRLTRHADRDHDGFPDVSDACPDQAATPGSTDGCPRDLPACGNGVDDDGDGRTDFPFDPDCVSAEDTDEVPDPTLTVDPGSGRVVSDPAGIDCGTACVHRYPRGQVVSLTPVPPDGQQFDHWAGACFGSAGCTIKLDGDASVQAVFTGRPPDCSRGVVHRAVRAPVYDARVPLAFLPDADLFTFAPTIRYCWDGFSAKVEGATVLGDVDYGPDTFALELLGFTVDYDAEKEAVTFARNEARISGDFGLDFDWVPMLSGMGAGKVTDKVLGKALKKAIQHLDDTKPGFDKTVINTEYIYFGNVSLALRDALRDWFRAAERQAAWLAGSPLWDSMERTIQDKLDEAVVLARDAAMALVSTSALAKKEAAADYVSKGAVKVTEKVLGDLTAWHLALWQPSYRFHVDPDGTVADSLDPDAYTNPLLLVSEKPAAPAPVPKLAGGGPALHGTTVSGTATCPAGGAPCTGTAFVALSQPARAVSAAKRRAARIERPVAHARFRIAAGHRGRIVVRLTRAQAARLRRPGGRAQVLLECTGPRLASAVRTVALRIPGGAR